MSTASLVVMAAGMASRYGASKQIEGMGPHGEILLDYSVRDAIRAGFDKVVLVIKPEMLERIKEVCGNRYAGEIQVCYAFQDYSSVPAKVPQGRTKPYGTVHAALCAAPFIEEPFAVLNADDYYGVESFAQMFQFLVHEAAPGRAAMIGYQLRNTISRYGTVSRGLCKVKDGCLTGIREVKKIALVDGLHIADLTDPEDPQPLFPESPVSMNFWGFHPQIMESMADSFKKFLGEHAGEMTSEYLLPIFVDEQLRSGMLNVQVIPTTAVWFGVTYQEDRPNVVEALRELHAAGIYG